MTFGDLGLRKKFRITMHRQDASPEGCLSEIVRCVVNRGAGSVNRGARRFARRAAGRDPSNSPMNRVFFDLLVLWPVRFHSRAAQY